MEAVAMKMVEEGKFLSKHEYDSCKTVPVRSAIVLNFFGSWTRLISLIKQDMPHVVQQIEGSKPAKVVTKVETKPEIKPQFKPKEDPFAKLRSAVVADENRATNE